MVAHVWYQSHTIISVSPARVLQLCFKKDFFLEIKLAIIAQRLKVVKILAALSILNSSGDTEKVAALALALLKK